jgi:hypothetical protein
MMMVMPGDGDEHKVDYNTLPWHAACKSPSSKFDMRMQPKNLAGVRMRGGVARAHACIAQATEGGGVTPCYN